MTAQNAQSDFQGKNTKPGGALGFARAAIAAVLCLVATVVGAAGLIVVCIGWALGCVAGRISPTRKACLSEAPKFSAMTILHRSFASIGGRA